MLGYVALADGRTVPRDLLAALLWPDSPDEQARASLRHALAVIRQALAPTAARCLVTDADTVALDPRCVDVDVTAFERSRRHETVPELETAMALYGGDLLAGLRIDERPFEDGGTATVEAHDEDVIADVALGRPRDQLAGWRQRDPVGTLAQLEIIGRTLLGEPNFQHLPGENAEFPIACPFFFAEGEEHTRTVTPAFRLAKCSRIFENTF